MAAVGRLRRKRGRPGPVVTLFLKSCELEKETATTPSTPNNRHQKDLKWAVFCSGNLVLLDAQETEKQREPTSCLFLARPIILSGARTAYQFKRKSSQLLTGP